MSPIGLWNAARSRITDRWRSIKRQRPGIAHVADAYQHYKDHHGDHLAAAITYFSFLALFPLIFLAVSVGGFILTAHPNLKDDLFSAIHRNVPGDFGNTVANAIDAAINSRTSVGLIGVVGIALAGLGWVANLRKAIDIVWGSTPLERNFFLSKALDALALVGLGLAVAISLGLTFVGTVASHRVIDWIGWTNTSWTGLATKVIGIALAVLGDMLVFGWLLIRLPQVLVTRRIAIRTTLLAAVGFEVLKLVGTYYLARIAQSPAAAALGAVIGILIFINLVSRYLLYCVAWAAVATTAGKPAAIVAEPPAQEAPAATPSRPEPVSPVSPVGLAAGLLSVGVALGAGSVAALQRRRSRARTQRRAKV
jgi:membrane protein